MICICEKIGSGWSAGWSNRLKGKVANRYGRDTRNRIGMRKPDCVAVKTFDLDPMDATSATLPKAEKCVVTFRKMVSIRFVSRFKFPPWTVCNTAIGAMLPFFMYHPQYRYYAAY